MVTDLRPVAQTEAVLASPVVVPQGSCVPSPNGLPSSSSVHTCPGSERKKPHVIVVYLTKLRDFLQDILYAVCCCFISKEKMRVHREIRFLEIQRSQAVDERARLSELPELPGLPEGHPARVWFSSRAERILRLDRQIHDLDIAIDAIRHSQRHGGDRPVEAPLTLVRSEHPTQLKISVLFNRQFLPQQPIVPAPTSITTSALHTKYTWDVVTQRDGTMHTRPLQGVPARIQMIWWEAVRRGAFIPFNPQEAVCVEKSELRAFLQSALRKIGLQDRELNAFTQYWHQVFTAHPGFSDMPHVLVQLVDPTQLPQFIPQMTVEGDRASQFGLHRLYFRFAPISQPTSAMDATTYLSQLQNRNLGPNAVLDLGGEVVPAEQGRSDTHWPERDVFNDAFVRQHIFAQP